MTSCFLEFFFGGHLGKGRGRDNSEHARLLCNKATLYMYKLVRAPVSYLGISTLQDPSKSSCCVLQCNWSNRCQKYGNEVFHVAFS